MKTFAYISKSIGLMQATLLLAAALLIGFGLSAWQMRAALGEQRAAVTDHAERLLDLSLSGAANAAWALNDKLAREVADGIIRQEGVMVIEIHADFGHGAGQLLARMENKAPPAGRLTAWVAQNYFADVARASRKLSILQQGKAVDVGTIAVEIAPAYGAEKYIALLKSVLTVSLLEAVLTGAALLLIVQWLITTPLRRGAA